MHCTDKGLIVSIIRKKTDKAELGTTFVVPNLSNENCNSVELYKDYLIMRKRVEHPRLFVTWDKKKQIFKNNPIGKNTMATFPKMAAEFLKLDNPKSYTGHSLRASSATVLADSGVSLENLKRHGGWKSTTVAEEYVRESVQHKTDMAQCLSTATTNTTHSNISTPGIVFVNCVFDNSVINTLTKN